jgi:hypothetical protein
MEKNSSNQYRIWIESIMMRPTKGEILKLFYTLHADDSLSNFDFFDIIGEIYQREPAFFMLKIYPKIRRKFGKIYKNEGMRVMDKYILEKFCLDEGEQIKHEFYGTVKLKVPKKYVIRIINGTFYVTNRRIIAQGKLGFDLDLSTGQAILEFGGGSTKNPKKALKHYISSSKSCYGYSIPIKNLYKLNRFTTGSKIKKLSYLVPQKTKITINISKKEGIGEKLYEILNDFQARE